MKEYNKSKVVLGQFYTKEKLWLKPQIINFIKNSGCEIIYDPFAGEGHILNTVKELGFKEIIGLDIDSKLGWKVNDSLKSIPYINDKTIIITNPPYLTSYSAARKKIIKKVKKYFDRTDYDDLYLIALDNMLNAQNYVVAIVPETFINSNFKKKNLLNSITILEENPFYDTDAPVAVVCFDGVNKDLSKIGVYKNDVYINNLDQFEKMRLTPNRSVKMTFNDVNGWLAVRCVDSTDPNEKIRFGYKKDINYDWKSSIKNSSRLLTLIDIDIPSEFKYNLIKECNNLLNEFREKTNDIILSPFKGNTKTGIRRRRLDFKTCRAIIEIAYHNIFQR